MRNGLPFASSLTTDPVDIEALVDFYYSTNEGLKSYSGWDTINSTSMSDPCSDGWYGVSCNSTFNKYKKVTELQLISLGLIGINQNI